MARIRTAIAGLCLCGLSSKFSAIDVKAQGLPGGATSLNETPEDWTVSCANQDGTTRCDMVKQQVFGDQHQSLLTLQLSPTAGHAGVEGTLVLPFGFHLDKGVILSMESAEVMSDPRFLTCLPMGCVVPLTLEAQAVAALRSGTAIRLVAIASESAQDVAFAISLAGSSSAFDRVVQLKES